MNSDEARLKRLKIRSWRRGTREMDLILGPFFDDNGHGLTAGELDDYEALLSENDHDLYAWVAGKADTPARFSDLIARVRSSRPSV